MIRRYEAVLWKRNDREYTWERAQSRRFKRRESARRQALRWLAPVYTTTDTMRRDFARADFAEVQDRRRIGVSFPETIQAPIVLVPSVGELGWAP